MVLAKLILITGLIALMLHFGFQILDAGLEVEACTSYQRCAP